MALDLSREREEQLKLKSRQEGRTWRPKEEPEINVIRVFKFTHKVTKEDIQSKAFSKEDLGKTYELWNYPVIMHYGLNPKNPKAPVLSTLEIMELYKTLSSSKLPQDKEKAKAIRPSKKYAINILDLNEPDKGIQIYLAPKTIREFIGDHLIDDDFGEAILGHKGRDIKFKYNSKASDPKDFYRPLLQDKDKSRPMNSKISEKTYDLYDPKINVSFVEELGFNDLSIPKETNGTDHLKVDLESPKQANVVKDEIDELFDAD